MYASPIVEPSNFLEEDFSVIMNPVNGTDNIQAQVSFDTILESLPTSSVGRFRITSVVFDPPIVAYSGAAGAIPASGIPQLEVVTYGGVHYEQNVTTRSLKIRCSNKYGNVGQWVRTNGGSLCPENSLPVPGTTPGTVAAFTLTLKNVNTDQDATGRLEMHVRIAWDDLDAA